MADVFISYHIDSAKHIVHKISADLEARGVSCWYSKVGVRGGEDFADNVPEEIRKCTVFLLILDCGAMESRHVRREVGIADKAKVIILPFQAEDCVLNGSMEYYLEGIQIMNKPFLFPAGEPLKRMEDRVAQIIRMERELREEEARKRREEERKRQEEERKRREEEDRRAREYARKEAEEQRRQRRTERVKGPRDKQTRIAVIVQILALTSPLLTFLIWFLFHMFQPLPDNGFSGTAKTISSGYAHVIAVKADGTVTAAGDNRYGQCNVSDWGYITEVSAGGEFSAGLRMDGTIALAGSSTLSFQSAFWLQSDLGWSNISSISAGEAHLVGLREDGTVIAAGYNNKGQCNVSDWKNVICVEAGSYHTAGLLENGTVIATGDNSYGQCDVSGWNDIVAVAANFDATYGLQSDGTVVTAGNAYGVSNWTGITAISAGMFHVVGLHSDGTVAAVGLDAVIADYDQCDVDDWSDIVAISAGAKFTVGLRSDGTVVATGDNEYGQCDVSDWTGIKVP